MENKNLLKKIEYAEYIAIGLAIGIIFSLLFDVSIINGFLIGISFGILLQKMIQENKIILAIFVITGLTISCLIANIFELSKSMSMLSLSVGMLLGAIVYLFIFKKEKKQELNAIFAIYLLTGILIGAIVGTLCYSLMGACLGIGIGMILSIIFYLKK